MASQSPGHVSQGTTLEQLERVLLAGVTDPQEQGAAFISKVASKTTCAHVAPSAYTVEALERELKMGQVANENRSAQQGEDAKCQHVTPAVFKVEDLEREFVARCGADQNIPRFVSLDKHVLSTATPASVADMQLDALRGELQHVALLPQAGVATVSVGSTLHGSGNCRPCAWFWKPGGCRNGGSCMHCHLCSESELRSRKKAKLTLMRSGVDVTRFATPSKIVSAHSTSKTVISDANEREVLPILGCVSQQCPNSVIEGTAKSVESSLDNGPMCSLLSSADLALVDMMAKALAQTASANSNGASRYDLKSGMDVLQNSLSTLCESKGGEDQDVIEFGETRSSDVASGDASCFATRPGHGHGSPYLEEKSERSLLVQLDSVTTDCAPIDSLAVETTVAAACNTPTRGLGQESGKVLKVIRESEEVTVQNSNCNLAAPSTDVGHDEDFKLGEHLSPTPSNPVEVEPASLGSALHGSGACRPCAWFWKPFGCWLGKACRHCHSCPVGELKARKKIKSESMRKGISVGSQEAGRLSCAKLKSIEQHLPQIGDNGLQDCTDGLMKGNWSEGNVKGGLRLWPLQQLSDSNISLVPSMFTQYDEDTDMEALSSVAMDKLSILTSVSLEEGNASSLETQY